MIPRSTGAGLEAADSSSILRLAARAALLGALLFALAPGEALARPCSPAATRLCLGGERFAVEVAWIVPGFGSGAGRAVPLTEDTGLFWFFQNANLELVVKVLDGRTVNGHFWIYYGGLSDVEYTVTVTDTQTGVQEIYHNPPGKLASRADSSAFDAVPLAAGHTVRFGALGEGTAAAAVPSPTPAPLRQGPEFPVNVTTRGMQRNPSVAVGPDGGFMVVWMGEPGVFGRLYDRAGAPRTGEFRLDVAAADRFPYAPKVAASATGEYMATWFEDGPSGTRAAARVFGADGQPLGEEIRIGVNPRRPWFPSIAADPAGGFLVVWPDVGATGEPPSIRWQRFDAQGNRVGRELAINRAGAEIRVAASPAGGFLLSWIEAAGDYETDVLALRLDAAGEPVVNTALRVNTDLDRLPGYHSAAVPLFHADGGFSIVWSTYVFYGRTGAPGFFARRYDANGAPAGAITKLRDGRSSSLLEPAAAALPSGETLVLWDGYSPADPDGGLFGQLFDGSWTPRGSPIRINTYTAEHQIEPAVAMDGSGNLVAVWSSGVDYSPILPPLGYGEGTQDGNYLGVFGQRFTTASCALGPGQLCLGGRFRAEVEFTNPWTGKPEAGRAVPLTSDTGSFWFFHESNVELIVKILDGRTVNGHFWLYAGALSDVAYTLTVTDTETGRKKTYRNDHGRLASRADGEAF